MKIEDIADRFRAYEAGRGTSRDGRAGRGDHDLNPDPDFRPATPLIPAAVLVPLVLREPAASILLTQRTAHLANHAGQISFPGGRVAPVDGTPVETALREAEEEVGLRREEVQVVGVLDRYVTRTGFEIVPVVGIVRPPFTLAPDPHEVAEVFEVPLAFILDPANHQLHSRRFQGRERHFWVLPYENRYIWGATAGMLVNLSEVLR